MAAKKTANKKTKAKGKAKPSAKKASAKKAPVKKSSAKKTATPQTKKTTRSALPASYTQLTKPFTQLPNVKRPPNTPPITQQVITEVTLLLEQVKAKLEAYAAHLRALDRRRLNNIGVKREGFAQRAFRLAMDNPEFLPHYLTRERYIDDYDQYVLMQTAIDADNQVHELMRNLGTENHDVFYTNGLDYYASVRESAKRRVDASEAIFEDLSPFFKSHGRRNENGEPTKKQLKRDFNALERGTRDGKIVIENIKPKMEGGTHKVIDETFKDTEKFKDTIEGNLNE
jgi:hypothetical protein